MNNTASSNILYGFTLSEFNNNNSLFNNTASNNERGINLRNSSINTISGNNVSENSAHGMWISLSNFNTIVGNRANNTSQGIDLDSSDSNVVSGNIVASNAISGLYMCQGSNNNTVFNNYLNNTKNTDIRNPNNAWNTTKTSGSNIVQGSYLGGNFWAKPDGSGFSESATDTDKDGIADTTYIETNLIDHLPLVYATPIISDAESPVITSVSLNNSTPYTGGSILVIVDTTDNVGVSEVKANSISLKNESGTWQGIITAHEGTHSVNVSSSDAAENIAWNNSTSYIASTPIPKVLPLADFTSNVSEGIAPLTVQFTYQSTNATSWFWDFGDGNNSTERNPIHEYTVQGNYTVNLTVSNANGTASKSTTIKVLPASSIPVFPGYANPPVDLNHDGLYEDINGNGILDFDDVIAYYVNMDWIEQNAQVVLFDYNKNRIIDFDDVIKLYNML